jgi:hypothetical protein
MQVQMNLRSLITVGVAALMAASTGLSCYESPQSFQPITTGAKPWNPYDVPNYDPNSPWNPQPTCTTGYYVAIEFHTLFAPGSPLPSACVGVHSGLVCSVRSRWFAVPMIFRPTTGWSS